MIAALVLLSASPVFGNNTYFLPGDAFFFVRLDLETTQNLQKQKSPVLQYGPKSNSAAGCGYIGYTKIELRNANADTKNALLEAFRKFESEIEDDLQAQLGAPTGKFIAKDPPKLKGKMNVFIYPSEYDWKKHRIAIRYNENWAEESVAFGTMPEHTALGEFSSNAIARSWRDSKLVSSLNAKCPKLPDGHGETFPTPCDTPVHVDASKCSFIVIPNRDFDSYIFPSNGIKLIEIAGGKLAYYQRENGEWRTKD